MQGPSPIHCDLEGTWEVAIVLIQYPFNWPNFNEEFVAFMVSVKESEAEQEKQKEPLATGDTPVLILDSNADCRVCNNHWIRTTKNSLIMPTTMQIKLEGNVT